MAVTGIVGVGAVFPNKGVGEAFVAELFCERGFVHGGSLAGDPVCTYAGVQEARMRHSDLVAVQACGTQAEADIARDIFESSGMEAVTQVDTAGGTRHLAWSGFGFRVLGVRRGDRDLLKCAPDADQVVVKTFSIEDEGGPRTGRAFVGRHCRNDPGRWRRRLAPWRVLAWLRVPPARP